MMKWVFFLLFFIFKNTTGELNDLVPTTNLRVIETPMNVPCNESQCTGPLAEIYCHGPILTNAWQFGLQKTCPGDKLRIPAKQVMEKFNKLEYPLKRIEFERFCNESFQEINYLEVVDLHDWDLKPSFAEEITNQTHKKFALELHERWKRLARRFTKDVLDNPELYPLIPVKNPFIVPGGRFDVYFYWDTYWIIKGLLVSDMTKTGEGIIDNFSRLIEEMGYVPNSGNIQLGRRSQPPLFSHMVWEFYKHTGYYERRWLDSIERELSFWESNRVVEIHGHKMFVYKSISNCPRPENFLSDYSVGIKTKNPTQVWKSIASACESGWDFSSRWMGHNETGHQDFLLYDFSSIHTDEIIPVDLNVFIANGYRYLYNIAKRDKKFDEAAFYRQKAELLAEAIQNVLWNEEKGAWFDFDLIENKLNLNFYPSNIYPMMIPGFEKKSDQVEKYIKSTGVLNFAGGIPSTLPSGSTQQQWDFPNVWAPNEYFVILCFVNSRSDWLVQKGKEQTLKFIDTVYNGLYNPLPGLEAGIWEKYDARSTKGQPGAGGEYIVQEGFGWTNGAVLDLIYSLYRKKQDFVPEFHSGDLDLSNNQQSGLVFFAAGFCAAIAILAIIKGVIWHRSRVSQDDVEAGTRLLVREESDDV